MSARAPVPRRAVDDEDSLWSFRVYGEADADAVLVLLPALGVPARYYAPPVREQPPPGASGRDLPSRTHRR